MGYVCASSRHVLPWDTICMASATQTGMTHGALGFWGVLFDVNNSSLSSVSIVHRFIAPSWRWMARVGGSGFALQHSLAWFCMLTCVSDACNHFENRAPMLESTARHGAKRPQLRLGAGSSHQVHALHEGAWTYEGAADGEKRCQHCKPSAQVTRLLHATVAA